MKQLRNIAAFIGSLALVGGALVGCSADSGADARDTPAGATVEGAPSWCGPNETSLALLDGAGGNSWRQINRGTAEDEASLCPSVVDVQYADGQGDTQKSISDIQGMVAKGVNAIVTIPDAGQALLPALRSAFNAGVVVVPYRVNPGGEPGSDYDAFVSGGFAHDGVNFANWIKEIKPDGAKIFVVSGPKGVSQGNDMAEALKGELSDTKYVFLSEDPFTPTNWDPAVTQQVLTAAIAKDPDLDVIVSDYGPSILGALPEFAKYGKSIPAIATVDGNAVGCFYEDSIDANPEMKLYTDETGIDNVRIAVRIAVAKATGGVMPEETEFVPEAFENSVTETPNAVQCDRDAPTDVYLSAALPVAEQATLIGH